MTHILKPHEMPMIGTRSRRLKVFQRLHNMPDELVLAMLEFDLTQMYGPGWYACVFLANGTGGLKGQTASVREPAQDVRDRMVELAQRLNKDLAHDGHWVVAWTADKHLGIIWRDRDGDLHLEHLFDKPWARAKRLSVEDMVKTARLALDAWDLLYRRAIDPSPAQTIKWAQGEGQTTY